MPPESGFLLGVDGFPLSTKFLIGLLNCQCRCARWVCPGPFAIDAIGICRRKSLLPTGLYSPSTLVCIAEILPVVIANRC
nr:hypothetical protein Itr_chr14CG13200 [Ipomoea trifida]